MNKKLITVSMPLEEFEALTIDHQHDPMESLEENCKYLNQLFEDVCNGKVPLSEATDFAFFQTNLGRAVLQLIKNDRNFQMRGIR